MMLEKECPLHSQPPVAAVGLAPHTSVHYHFINGLSSAFGQRQPFACQKSALALLQG